MVKFWRKLGALALSVALVFSSLAMLIFPLPHALSSEREVYRCIWDDGYAEESYASAYAALIGIGADGNLELKRGAHVGVIETGSRFRHAYAVFSQGNLFELVTLDMGGLSKLERTALYRRYGETIFYTSGAFAFDGERVKHVVPYFARELVLLEGGLPSGYLTSVGASKLRLTANAQVSARDLMESEVEEIATEAPYCAEGGALYLDGVGGRRLVAALPHLTELTLSESSFADMGALLPCKSLVSLTLPYAGSAINASGSAYIGEFAYLWEDAGEYRVPKTLRHVRITGGKLAPYSFYACDTIEEIDVCGLRAEDISAQAFLGASALKKLHVPGADVMLNGEFTKTFAPCGCTVFERV
ncbi:MAG: hypothetical protein IKD43_03450 [Clostridia bacterium]|nr:hypothetical protein [Clostridia bacterium]